MCDNKRMERIGIFGGTFNPVHAEHVEIVKAAIKELNLDKLFVMPTFLSPHKTLIPASAKDRVNMLRLALKGVENAEVSEYEIEKGGTSYTYQTAEEFRNRYKKAKIFWIVGADMLADFKTWKNPQRILDTVDLAVFGREDFGIDYQAEKEFFIKNYGKEFFKLKYNGKVCSSTKIRIYTAFGLDINGETIKSVADYINKNDLYPADEYVEFIKNNLPQKRVKHTANVVIAALYKAKENGVDIKKAMVAATLHDCAKYMDYRDFKDFVMPEGVPKPVEHSFLGAYVAERVLKVQDKEVLDAIKYHTSGTVGMTPLAKLIFVADMVEEDRDYEGVEVLREYYFKRSLDECFNKCLEEELLHLINKKQYIYSETLKAYEYYVKGKK